LAGEQDALDCLLFDISGRFLFFLKAFKGLSPATEGNLTKLFKFKFWNQPFVKYALAADGSHAMYTVIVSYVGGGEEG